MNKLKELRKKHHLKQSDVANYLKITQPNYSNFENRKINLNMDYAKLLAKLYKVPLSYLLENDEEIIYLTKEEFNTLKEAEKIIQKISDRSK